MAGAEPLGNVVLKLGLDNSKFGSELQRSKQLVKYATAEMKSNMAAMGASGSVFDKLTAKQQGLTNVMQAQQKEVAALQKRYEQSFTKTNQATKGTAKYATSLQNAQAKLGALNKEYVQTAVQAAKAKVANEGFTGQLNRTSKVLTSMGTNMSKVGSKMTTRVTTPIVAGLGAAVKLAVDFDSQIAQMGPLLTNGAKVTGAYQRQLDRLADSSKKWATQYGVSTTQINNGMSELIKRGFTAQQVMGSMPSILDATVASGEEMGTVMQATASIMEQFGLKGKTTAETLANTQRVTDSLTYAANKTSAGFGDMSDAMSYAGPQAAALGLTVEQTAAAIGMLSNMGIEGEKAGTNLRGMLTSLIKPTAQQTKAFNEMGISAQELARDSHDLPSLIRDLENGTKGLTKAEKARLIAMAFGKQNQSAVNALMKGGADELAKLTKETENADGATKKIAKTMSQTKANQIKRTVESIKQMGITIGQQLLPLVPPLLKDIQGLIKGFNELDDGTKQNIVKWIALTAAIGPFLKVGGGAITTVGKMGTAFVDFRKALAGWQAAKTAKDLVSVGDAALQTTGSVTKMGGATSLGQKLLGKFGGAAVTAGAGSTSFLGALAPLAPAIIGVGAVVGTGIAVWELWGKKAYQNSQEVGRWGTAVGKKADESLQNFQDFQSGASVALSGFKDDSKASTQKVGNYFDKMYAQIKKSGKESIKEINDVYKGLPAAVQKVIKEGVQDDKDEINQAVKDAKKVTTMVNGIKKNASKENRKITAEENQVILNSQRDMNEAMVQSLNLSASKQKNVLKVLNGDIGALNKQQRESTIKSITESTRKTTEAFLKDWDQLDKAYKDKKIDTSTYTDALKALKKDYSKNTDSMIASAYKLMKSQGYTKTKMIDAFQRMGVSYDDAEKIAGKFSKKTSQHLSLVADTASKMSKKSREAGKAWNDIALDPKTGEVKTNLQEVINDAANTNEGWNKLIFAAKNAKIDSNAKAMIGEAAIANGTWDSLTWDIRELLVASNVDAEIAKALTANGQWAGLTFEQKAALIHAEGTKELTDVLFQAGVWNSLSIDEQLATIKTQGTKDFVNALYDADIWQGLSLKEQQAIVQTKGESALADMVIKYGNWNQLPEKTKNLLINNDDARQKLTDAGVLADIYNSKEIGQKKATADETDFVSKVGHMAKLMDEHNVKQVNTKKFPGDASSVESASGKSTSAVDRSNNKKVNTKKFPGDALSVIGASSKGVSSVGKFNGAKPGLKKFKGQDNASGPAKAAKRNVDAFGGNETIKKTFTVVTNFIGSAAKKVANFLGFAHGTDYFTGEGLALVNDQTGATFRELIQLPTGETFIPHGRNVIFPDLPTGSKVVPANKTKAMFPGLKQYATGKNIPANADVVTLTNSLSANLQKQTLTQTTANNGELTALLSSMVEAVNRMAKAVAEDQEKVVINSVDGRTVSRTLAPYLNKELNGLNAKQTRLAEGRLS